jgi:membrane-bound lytic murein transglycosylase D
MPQQEVTTSSAPPETEESLTEELSARRLEELYARSGIPGWDPGLEAELKTWEHQVGFDVPIQMNKQVRAYLVYFSTERKETIRRYLSRSTRYLPMIKEIFQEYGLPDDMAYLAMIESGFNNTAYSHASACGMWQFIRGTGVRYGLTIDSYVDERRDPVKATRAAAKYLLDLYKRFGSWYLAAASYNCGEGRVERELNQSTHRNFWELSANQCLPTETKNYVPQMIAATIIAKNPEKFGFRNIPHLPPLATEQVRVNEPTSLRAAAYAVNVPVEDVQALNPELLRGVTPPDAGAYTLNLPPKSKGLFERNITLARIEHPAVATRSVRTARGNGRAVQSQSSPRQTDRRGKATNRQNTRVASGKKPKPSQTTASGVRPSPQLANMFGHPSAAARNAQQNRQTPTPPSGKTKAQKDKKQGGSEVAKRGENNTSNHNRPKKNGSNTNKSKDKDKVSRAGSKQVMAEAR